VAGRSAVDALGVEEGGDVGGERRLGGGARVGCAFAGHSLSLPRPR
jgi:hypothetical protein